MTTTNDPANDPPSNPANDLPNDLPSNPPNDPAGSPPSDLAGIRPPERGSGSAFPGPEQVYGTARSRPAGPAPWPPYPAPSGGPAPWQPYPAPSGGPAPWPPHPAPSGGLIPWPPHPPRRDSLPPLPAFRRIAEIDALRGFALLGILVVNVLAMAGPYGLAGGPGAGAAGSAGPYGLAGGAGGAGGPDATGGVIGVLGGTVDSVVAWLVAFLFEGKFYLLFSFLFGYSLTLQMAAAERAGAAIGPRTLRRLLGLFVLGLLHAVFLFSGDILMTYAVLGLILFAARDAGPRRARAAAAWVWGAYSALFLLIGALYALVGPDAAIDQEIRDEAVALTAGYRGSFGDVVGAHLGELPFALAGVLLGGGMVVPAFLIGLAAGRTGWFERVERAMLLRTVRIGLAIGLPTAALAASGEVGPLPERYSLLAATVGMCAAPALTAAYLAGMLLWFRTRPGARASKLLAPAGRMSLTNYLTQSLVMALLFTGYGLGLYGRLGIAVPVLLALLLYGAQLAVSARLMRRFGHGPVERALRTLTLWGGPGRGISPSADQVNDR